MKENLKITIIQSDLVWENPKKNIQKFTSLINRIDTDTDLIVLPEMFTTGFSMNPQKLAETMNGESVQWLINTAKIKGISIITSLIIKENNEYYNRLFYVNQDGEFQTYDKRHLFRMGNEHNHYKAGRKKLIVNLHGWRIMPLICYDLRFPVWSRNNNDYDIGIYIANWPEARNGIWSTLLKARALENQAYIVGVNRIGNDGEGLSYSGDSVILSSKAETMSKTVAYMESVETVSLSMDDLLEFRKKFPVLLDADSFKIN